MEDNKAELHKQLCVPFEHEQHLKDLLKEQIELNNKLNLDKHDQVIDNADEEVSNDKEEIPVSI